MWGQNQCPHPLCGPRTSNGGGNRRAGGVFHSKHSKVFTDQTSLPLTASSQGVLVTVLEVGQPRIRSGTGEGSDMWKGDEINKT